MKKTEIRALEFNIGFSTMIQYQSVIRKLVALVLVLGCGIWSDLFAQTESGTQIASSDKGSSMMFTASKDKNVSFKRDARLDQWYNADSKGGLFVHWGLGTGKTPGNLMYQNVQAFEDATEAANWTPQPMVDAAVKLNCKYIVWATLHVEHGLIRTWKSKIPGTPTTKRDYLGELCNAAALKGIKIVVYMNGDASTKNANVKNFIDGVAYAKYKNSSIDIKNNIDHWIRYFIKDNMFEIMDNYPNVIGFWCDGWDRPSVDTVTLSAVHTKNQNYLIFRNEYGNQPSYDDVDVMGVEPFAKILSPKYDKSSGMYVKSGNGVEASFVISADWWYTGNNYSTDPKWCVKMAASALGGNAVPCYAEGPTISGDFVANVNSTNDVMKKFFDYASVATNNVWGGGYSHGGFKPGTVGDSAYVATTMSKDGNSHFIHVLNKPFKNPNQLLIPMLGYKVNGVKSLATNENLTYYLDNDNLVITVSSWDKFDVFGDEIIQITTDGRPNVLSRNGWSIIANNVSSGFPASNAIDSTHDTYYSSQNDANMPIELTIKMGSKNRIYGINLNQYEARALTKADYYHTNEGTRIKDYEVYASSDVSDWGSALVYGTLENERGVKEIQIPSGTGNKSYIKLKILSNYNGNGVVQIANIDLLKISK